MRQKAVNILKFVIGWPLSLLALFFLLRLLLPNLSQIQESLKTIDFFLLGISILCFLGYYLSRTFLWHHLLRATGANVPLKKTAYLWSMSEANRYIPGNIWSFLSRSVKFAEFQISKKDLATSLAQETLFILAGAAVIFLFSVPFLRSIEAISVFIASIPDLLLWAVIIGSVTVLVLQGLIFWRIKFLKKTFSERNYTLAQTISYFLFSFVGLFFFGFGYYFAVSSVVRLPVEEFFTISSFAVVSLLVGYLSFITPAGLGVREGFLTVGLANFMTVPLAGFAAIFARVILIASEVVFVFLAKIWSSHRNGTLERLEEKLKRNPQTVLLSLGVLVYSVFISVVSLTKYHNFNMGRFDLGNMVQTVWNTSQGRIFEMSDPNGMEIVSRLAFHADFILVFFAPIYAVIPHPGVLLITQTIVVALGAFFVYGISNILLKNKWAGLLISFSYLLNPSLIWANLYDFHSVVLATTFLLASWYFYLKRRLVIMIIFLILAGITKEQVWAVTSLFGFFISSIGLVRAYKENKLGEIFHNKDFILGIGIFTACLFAFYTTFTYLIPGARSGQEHFALEFFGQFGETPKELAINILQRPWEVVKIVTSEGRVEYLKMILAPVGYLPILSPVILVFIIPDLTINLLASSPNFQQIYYQYTAVITPFLFIASIYSIRFLNKHIPRLKVIYLAGYLFIAAIYGAYLYGPLPGSINPNTGMFDKPTPNARGISEYLKTIPHSATVAATNNAGSHLSERRLITTLPIGAYDTDYVVFLISEKENEDLEHKESITRLLNNPNYILLKKFDNFYVFRRLHILVTNH